MSTSSVISASFPRSGLLCDDVCSYSVEVLWGRIEGMTAVIKNIKGFGHLKRTAVEIKQYIRTNYKTDDYFMPAGYAWIAYWFVLEQLEH